MELAEYDERQLAEDEFAEKAGDFLVRNFSSEVEVNYPTAKTNHQWELQNQGYVGQIQLPGDQSIVLVPKVEMNNVYGMMEYAYDLGDFDLSSVFDSDTVEGFYDRIANILAENVMDRYRRGLHKSYVKRSERSETIRGKINFAKTAQKPWSPKAYIGYSEMTADNEDNQILLYTLNRISASSNLCRDETLSKTRRGIRSLRGMISYKEFEPSACARRRYNRLNQDYERLHALSRMILDNTGASYKSGDRKTVPFTVNMPLLYQGFVTKWLDKNLPPRFQVKPEERVELTKFAGSDIRYRIDIVIYDEENGDEPICVIDVKYKADKRPKTDDISQMLGYAKAKDTAESFLMYPEFLEDSLDLELGDVRVRNLRFGIDDDLDDAGNRFQNDLSAALSIPELAV
jgi:5-methylcytosine-specific restriction enzyme subunit McrC